MDVDELDAWLGTGDEESGAQGAGGQGSGGQDGGGRSRAPWGAAPPRTDDLGSGRDDRGRRWAPIAGGALLLWLLVMAVAFGRGSGTATDDADESPSVMDTAMAAGSAATEAIGTTEDAGTTDAAEARGPPDAPAAGAGTDRYLEWAVPVERVPLHEDVTLVVLDAVWLRGRDGVFDRAEAGRWAVPVDADGAALTAPWAVGAAIPHDPPEPVEPPVLRQRVAEVEDALVADGWTDVVVHASDAHTDLTGVWVVVVDGVDPAGVQRVGTLLWLHDDGILRVLGGSR
ncbi:hypothetical protein [Euzebya pacifica]|uniref:hypothetical protein n=1 Tax=Euzebya pacifica TaxID=1608957 RepID=UPI0030FBBA61